LEIGYGDVYVADFGYRFLKLKIFYVKIAINQRANYKHKYADKDSQDQAGLPAFSMEAVNVFLCVYRGLFVPFTWHKLTP
jgi:hypothetical protein